MVSGKAREVGFKVKKDTTGGAWVEGVTVRSLWDNKMQKSLLLGRKRMGVYFRAWHLLVSEPLTVPKRTSQEYSSQVPAGTSTDISPIVNPY